MLELLQNNHSPDCHFIRQLFGHGQKDRELEEVTKKAMEKIFNHAWEGRHGAIPSAIGVNDKKSQKATATPWKDEDQVSIH
ncbi:hypothetical protein PV327_008169 [Microctonus hyperodae]|uniref:Uncharacterized protein n=1 Tax=Microctonus hyperodae TaxID=165561 RepID=A0AA39KGN8_MICHY|nr:hypothetical protein PV327_008169 [Microctonus hyperodae]